MRNLGILGSTQGTDMLAVIAAIQQKKLAAKIQVVISNKSDAKILERAQEYGIQTAFVDPIHLQRETYDKKISALLRANQVEYVVLIGYMRILSDTFINEWRNHIINVHPSLLPDFAGGIDANVHQAVLASGVKKTGCTVHYVTEEVDAGPILIQKECPVLATDTIESLKTRVQQLEGEALVEAIGVLINDE
ncbi:MAG: phosphoribosylglycinamide formyltransferase [Gammaproteobacteria bacterium]